MYFDLIKFPLEHENLRWEAGEAVLDIHGRPHLFVRIKLTGTAFPMIAQIPQVWIGKVFARHVRIDEDRQTIRAYFDEPLPRDGDIYFGHLGTAELRFGRFDPVAVATLDRARLPNDTVIRHPPPG
jgi:hypothetical protein